MSADHPDSFCDCDEVEVRARPIGGNNAIAFYKQCLRCGRAVGGAIKKSAVDGVVPPWDRLAEDRGWQLYREWCRAKTNDRIAEHEADRAARDAAFSAEYEQYLGSVEWQDKRRQVLQRDNFLCQGCRSARATEVHHLTYANVFNEFLWELVAICASCHRRLHGKDDPWGS